MKLGGCIREISYKCRHQQEIGLYCYPASFSIQSVVHMCALERNDWSSDAGGRNLKGGANDRFDA